jgi:RNA polymerase sigma factor (TIGR02999 family)
MSEPTCDGDERPGDVTHLLDDLTAGKEHAFDELLPLVERELRRRAAGYMRRERQNHTLQPTALVNEAFLRLVDQRNVRWQNRAHFFAVASQAMRRILVDHARSHQRAKRGGPAPAVTLDEAMIASEERSIDLLALDHALERLAALDERQARVVEMRFFGGLSVEETAEILDISPATVKREWSMARAWLHSELSGRSPRGAE